MENVYFVSDSFVDYLGDEHKFTVAAVIMSNEGLYVTSEYDTSFELPCELRVGLGVAICNTKDVWDPKKGEKIAEGRARKYGDDSAVITSKAMRALINEDSIQALLESEAEYIKVHPGKYISGYDEKVRKYEENQKKIELKSSLAEHEQDLIDLIESGQISSTCKELLKKSLN